MNSMDHQPTIPLPLRPAPADHPELRQEDSAPSAPPASALTQDTMHLDSDLMNTADLDATEYVRSLIARSKEEAAARGNVPPLAERTPKREPVQSVQPLTSDVGLANAGLNDAGLDDAGLDDAGLDEMIIDDCPAVFTPAAAAPEMFDVPLPPARTKPEETVDFSQLREAARLTATSALDAFDRKRLIARGYSYVVLVVFGLFMSLILLTMTRHVDSLAFGASIGMLILAAAATYRHAAISSELACKSQPRI